MKQIKTKSGNILVIEVPEDIKDYEKLEWYKRYVDFVMHPIKDYGIFKDNNPYNSLILGKLSEITEDDCKEFVEKANDELLDINDNHWEDYTKTYWEDDLPTAKQSFISLLQSEGINTSNEEELLIIKTI
jgi:hypothetical protein